jgi:hypothetical protein
VLFDARLTPLNAAAGPSAADVAFAHRKQKGSA